MLKLKILSQKAMNSIKGSKQCCTTGCNCVKKSPDYADGSVETFITAFGNEFSTTT